MRSVTDEQNLTENLLCTSCANKIQQYAESMRFLGEFPKNRVPFSTRSCRPALDSNL